MGRGLDRHGDPVIALRRRSQAQPPAEPPSPVRQHPAPRVHPPLEQADLPLRHRRPGGTPDGSALSIRVPTAPIYRVTTATTRSCPTTAAGFINWPRCPAQPIDVHWRTPASSHGHRRQIGQQHPRFRVVGPRCHRQRTRHPLRDVRDGAPGALPIHAAVRVPGAAPAGVPDRSARRSTRGARTGGRCHPVDRRHPGRVPPVRPSRACLSSRAWRRCTHAD